MVAMAPLELFGSYTDHLTLVFAGRAVSTIGGAADRERYAAKVRAEADRLPGRIFWEALDQLFPELLSVSELLVILSSIGTDVRDEALGLHYHGPRFPEQIIGRADLELLLDGLLGQLGPVRQVSEKAESPRERAYYPMISATAHGCSKPWEPDEAQRLALDAALRLGEGHRYRPSDEEARELKAAILRSPERRRAAFWRAAERFATHLCSGRRGLQDPSDLDFIGWSPGLSEADVDWLLEDMTGRPTEAQRRLACVALMEIWQRGSRDQHLLSRIVSYAGGHPGLKEVCDLCLAPRTHSGRAAVPGRARTPPARTRRTAGRTGSIVADLPGQAPCRSRRVDPTAAPNAGPCRCPLVQPLGVADEHGRRALIAMRLITCDRLNRSSVRNLLQPFAKH